MPTPVQRRPRMTSDPSPPARPNARIAETSRPIRRAVRRRFVPAACQAAVWGRSAGKPPPLCWNSKIAFPQRNGGRHCCQPPLRRAKDMPVFVTWSPENPKAPMKPALDPGSPAQASLPIWQLSLPRSPADLPDCASRRFAGLFNLPGLIETGASIKTTRCSAALLGATSTASRFAHQNSEEPGSRVARQEDCLFRRLFPAGPDKNRSSHHCLPAEIGPLVTCRTLRVVADPSGEAGTAVPIT